MKFNRRKKSWIFFVPSFKILLGMDFSGDAYQSLEPLLLQLYLHLNFNLYDEIVVLYGEVREEAYS